MLRRTLALAAFFALASTLCAAEERDPVPTPAEQAEALKLVHDVYKAEYAKTKPAERKALAETLLKQAEESKDAASAYVLLREARDIAAKAGDVLGAMSAGDAMAQRFKITAVEAKAPVIDLAASSALTVDAAAEVAEAAFTTADAAIAAEDFDAAAKLLKTAEPLARKGQSISLASAIAARAKSLEAIKTEGVKAKLNKSILAEKPDDPEANLQLGKYLCVYKRDWDAGLPHLAKSTDAAWKDAAAKDAAAVAAPDALAAADAWFTLASKLDGDAKLSLNLRALALYERAAPDLDGLAKAKAEKRLDEVRKLVETPSDRSKLFAAIRKAISADKLNAWRFVGGAFARTEFKEVPAEGALLIGFSYTTKNEGRYPDAVQAIYLTSRGEITGALRGNVAPGTKLSTVKAKPGYAVGAIYVRGGGGFDAFKCTFMKIDYKNFKLVTTDSYEGPHIGGQGGGEGTLGGDGEPIVGIHGKVTDHVREKGKVETLSPVSISDGTATPTHGPVKKSRRLP